MDVQKFDINRAQKRLRKYRILWVLDVLFLIICVGCLSGGIFLKNIAYKNAINISPSTDPALKQKTFLQAINLCPDRPDAYQLLLDSFNEDGIFTKEESEAFLNSYNSNHTSLSDKAEGYAELHYTAGLMYINGYDTDASSRMRMAIPFFDEAKRTLSQKDTLATTVACYCQIGTFYKDYIWNTSAAVREVDPTQMQELIDNIHKTISALNNENNPETTFNKLGFYSAVCNLFYDQRDTLAVTVEEDSVFEVINEIYDTLPKAEDVQKEQIRVLLETLEGNKEFYHNALERAFNRTEDSN